jgi:NAD(P)-dependent dehydrogenase (short-subunit alcohol dehydrogenase family)
MEAQGEGAQLALGTYGRVDVLFNLAAVSYFNWLQDITDEEWDRARRDEVDLVFYLTREAWPHLKAGAPLAGLNLIRLP